MHDPQGAGYEHHSQADHPRERYIRTSAGGPMTLGLHSRGDRFDISSGKVAVARVIGWVRHGIVTRCLSQAKAFSTRLAITSCVAYIGQGISTRCGLQCGRQLADSPTLHLLLHSTCRARIELTNVGNFSEDRSFSAFALVSVSDPTQLMYCCSN